MSQENNTAEASNMKKRVNGKSSGLIAKTPVTWKGVKFHFFDWNRDIESSLVLRIVESIKQEPDQDCHMKVFNWMDGYGVIDGQHTLHAVIMLGDIPRKLKISRMGDISGHGSKKVFLG